MAYKRVDKNKVEWDYTIDSPDLARYYNNAQYFEDLVKYIPVGIILGYVPADNSLSISDINTYLSDFNFVVCDGSQYNNPNSPIYNGAGRYLPNLTNDIFLRGFNVAGGTGGSNLLADHTHTFSLQTNEISYIGNSTLPAHGHTSPTITTSAGEHLGSHTITSGTNGSDGKDLLVTRFWGTFRGYCDFYYSIMGAGIDGHQKTIFPSITYTHTHSSWSVIVNNKNVNIAHTHNATITGSVGTDDPASFTDNKPNYLSCYFIQKVV